MSQDKKDQKSSNNSNRKHKTTDPALMLQMYDESLAWLELDWVQEKLKVRWQKCVSSNSKPFVFPPS